MSQHEHLHCLSLDCTLDAEVAQLVLSMNRIRGVQTISSCQGDPGLIEPGFYGHVAFKVAGTSWNLFQFAYCLKYQIDGLRLDDDIRLDVDVLKAVGWLRFRNEAIPKVCEMVQSIAGRPATSANGWNQGRLV